MTAEVPSRRISVRGVDTFLYDVGTGDVPVICLHGNPDSADAWLPLLRRSDELGRVIAPDLPGFGRSGREFEATLDAYVDWFEQFVDALGIVRYSLVVHDWGALALSAAARRPDRVAGIVAIDAVPLSANYRWHWIARFLWRPKVVGEIGMKVLNRFLIDILTRLQRPKLKPLAPALLDGFVRYLDPGMRRAILRLYRSAEPADLGRHGSRLAGLTCPALVIWGEQDPYVGIDQMAALAAALGGPVQTVRVEGGHWPMYDTDAVFERTAQFLRSGA